MQIKDTVTLTINVWKNGGGGLGGYIFGHFYGFPFVYVSHSMPSESAYKLLHYSY